MKHDEYTTYGNHMKDIYECLLFPDEYYDWYKKMNYKVIKQIYSLETKPQCFHRLKNLYENIISRFRLCY